jgi:hypothetical protein
VIFKPVFPNRKIKMCKFTTDDLNYVKYILEDALGLLGFNVFKAEGKPLPFERAMTELLLKEWGTATKRATDTAVKELIARQGIFSAEDVNSIMKQMRLDINDMFVASTADGIPVFMQHAYDKGKKHIYNKLGLYMDWNYVDENALYWLENHHMYWVESYYDKHISNALSRYVAEGMEQGLGRKEVGQRIKGFFNKYTGVNFKPDSYWTGFAANGMNRARNFGLVQGYDELGIQYLEILAVMDERTSAICKNMNGKRIPVNAAVGQRDMLMAAQDPEDVKIISPWPKGVLVDQLKTMSTDGLVAEGVIMPPYHFHCRTTVVDVLTKSIRKRVQALQQKRGINAAGLEESAVVPVFR